MVILKFCSPKNFIKITIIEKSFFRKIVLKNIRYKKFDIGASVYSSYIGLSRDHELDGYLGQSALERLYKTSKTFYNFFENYLLNNKISKIILYNGRHNEYRPLLRIAQKKNTNRDNGVFR